VTGYGVDHVVSRTVRDSAAMLDATGYPESAVPYAPPPKERPYVDEIRTAPGRLRIAFSSETPRGIDIDPENQAAMDATAKLLEELGHDVEERGLGIDYRALYRAQGIVGSANSAANLLEMIERIGREPREDEFEPLTWAGFRRGQKRSGEEVMGALRALRDRCREILEFFDDVDVYLTPVMGTPPPPIGFIDPVNLEPREVGRRQADVFPFTPPFNFTGQPAMSMPLAWSSDGLPLGMQFVARYGDEATLFRLAAQLEQARPWIDRRPQVWG
jgi:amidase